MDATAWFNQNSGVLIPELQTMTCKDTLLIVRRGEHGKEQALPSPVTHPPGWQLTEVLISPAVPFMQSLLPSFSCHCWRMLDSTPAPLSLSFALSRPFSQTHKHEQTCSHTHEWTNKCAQTHMHTLPSSHFSPGLTHMLSTLTHYLSSDPVSVSDDIHFAPHSSFLSLSLALTLWNMIIIVTLIVLPIHLKRL